MCFTMYRALQEADVILLVGARLNWILHFGLPPRFNRDVRIIQVNDTLLFLTVSMLLSNVLSSSAQCSGSAWSTTFMLWLLFIHNFKETNIFRLILGGDMCRGIWKQCPSACDAARTAQASAETGLSRYINWF